MLAVYQLPTLKTKLSFRLTFNVPKPNARTIFFANSSKLSIFAFRFVFYKKYKHYPCSIFVFLRVHARTS